MPVHFWSVKAAEGFFHSFAGWIVSVVAFVVLLGKNDLIVAVQHRCQQAPR